MQTFSIGDVSEVAPARRGIGSFASQLGFSTEDAGRAALVATEIGTNLVKHGGGGELIVKQINDGTRRGIELLGLDKGAGMADVGKCLHDGYSTSGSPGTGLGAIERMSQRSSACRSDSKFSRAWAWAPRCWPTCGPTRASPPRSAWKSAPSSFPSPAKPTAATRGVTPSASRVC
jgi:anti-sigma regulatory factor (Ser/Thr protein kinase)